MEESACYRWIFDKGRRQALHERILDLGQQRFGDASKEVAEKIQRIRDLDCLRTLGVRLLRAASWEDLLDSP